MAGKYEKQILENLIVWLQWLRKWRGGGDEASYFPDEEKGEVNNIVSYI